ncbi:Gfo/Idh/MocA family oxidoreductase [Devosia algicola]|uniref:Gfo/Idh/MocA family oxidoreductase n=1 Tax=Devosia algicola TaxID=3026418 RepID=A0ABY7YJE8_9HYPH|nr:Gfo/Idh/MocA family oxidoreductase [Devosia algicola]WDR01372.1 Gfo/Idh/MocA family oxidoreductase [Devosia algicola]
MWNYPAPITDRKIRFALIGCGRIAQNHFGALQTHSDNAEIVDVCDINEDAAGAAGNLTRAKTWTNLNDMLANSAADIVIVTTPSGIHAEQAMTIARSGKHVVSEKPMATRWEDGLAMVKVCDDAAVRLFVVKQNRRNATLQLLKNAVEQGRFGKIYMVNINVFWTRPQDYYDAAKWRGTWEFDGGAFMNQASHYVDLLDWIVGPIESLCADTATLARKIEAEDTGVVSIRWRSGALGSMNVTMLTYPKNLEGSITILGEKGTVRIGGVAVNQIEHWAFETPHADDAKVADASYATTSVYGFGHPLYYANVIDVLRGHAEPETDGRAGLRSLEVLTGIYRSARDGKRVHLPLDV